MDSTSSVTHLGLCAGYGGIELGLKRAIPSLRTISLCEIEAFAIANLVSKMEAGLMDPAPIWPDLKTFPWQSFRGRVDILTGGYPCQPFSAAGKRLGGEDPRHLWPHISRGISILQPRVCFFENVEGHITCGLHHVLCDLGRLGYRTTWGIFSASECGAPHQRKRVFIMANSQRQRVEELSRWIAGESKEYTAGDHGSNAWPSRPNELADASSAGYQQESRGLCSSEGETWISVAAESQQCGSSTWPSRPGERQYGWEPPRVVADTKLATGPTEIDQRQKPINQDGADLRDEYSSSSSAMADSHRVDRSAPAEGWEHDRQAGSASEAVMANTISGWGQQAGSECGSGEVAADSGCKEGTGYQQAVIPDDQGGNAAERQTQPPLGGDVDGPAGGLDYAQLCITCDNRTDELRLLGNGVVPATAERAFRILMSELDTTQDSR